MRGNDYIFDILISDFEKMNSWRQLKAFILLSEIEKLFNIYKRNHDDQPGLTFL